MNVCDVFGTPEEESSKRGDEGVHVVWLGVVWCDGWMGVRYIMSMAVGAIYAGGECLLAGVQDGSGEFHF